MKKILIVEDDLIVRSIYRRKFEMSGYEVATAEEGSAALALMPEFKPDVIQVDIMLPGLDGVEVIRQIRSWPEFRLTPILVLSSFYRPDLAKDAWTAGANKCVSKMDCTPNLALDLVEQLLANEASGFTPKYGTIALARDALDRPGEEGAPKKPTAPAEPKPETAAGPESDAAEKPKLRLSLDLPPSTGARPSMPTLSGENTRPSPPAPDTGESPKLRVALDLPPSTGAPPSMPSLAGESTRLAPPNEPKPEFFGGVAPPPFKPTTPPAAGSPAVPAPIVMPSPVGEATPPPPPLEITTAPAAVTSGSDFRVEVRQEFLRRAPQIQSELRDRVNALIKSKSTGDQMNLLRELAVCVGSLASLSGITGFSRISHLAGSMDALIQDLHKKPAQMTASVLRTIAHAADCLNVLFRDLTAISQDLPQSLLILAVDDEPISRRTVAIALSKANLRCIGLEDSRMALTILKENPFDLIFLDAEMPGMNGFELCVELRKLPTNKSTPVIFVTSMTNFEIRAQSSLSGGNDLIAKPFLMMELAVKALTYLLKPPPTVEARVRTAP
jgi:CheY-like chemotaxis protein